MQVVDAVEVHVLRVPGERGLPHAEVQVGRVDALDDDAALLLDHVQKSVEMSDVPLRDVLREETASGNIRLQFTKRLLVKCNVYST